MKRWTLSSKKLNSLIALFSCLLFSVLSSLNVNTAFAASSPTPYVSTQFAGYNNQLDSPPSTVIAASPTEEIQLVNTGYSIDSRSGINSSGTLNTFINHQGYFLSDPQIMWDPSTSRFYYSVMENNSNSTSNDGIAWGYSTTASPTSPSGFCNYFNNFNYGSSYFPDRQSLGDSAKYLLIGSDRYSTTSYNMVGSDIAYISKPVSGTSCEPASYFNSGIVSLVSNNNYPYLPVPARQVDSSDTSYALATPSYVSDNYLDQYTITDNTGQAPVISAAKSITVPTYTYPSFAKQAGKTLTGSAAPPLETTVYLSQVTMAYDPRIGQMALWTDHTVSGGYGTAVRWYEINPAGLALDQSGTVSSTSLDAFNGVIVPDRLVNGSVSKYGSNAVIEFNTSSLSSYPAIRMESIVNGQAASSMQLVTQSPGAYVDFACFEPGENFCRWGDYAGAAPDPGASQSAQVGAVWLTNEWNVRQINDNTPTWRTNIWIVKQ